MAVRGKQSEKKIPAVSWSRQILLEGLGIALIAVAIFILLTLLSFHPDDPSWNQTGGAVVHNAAGLLGATVSDALLQSLGYAALGVVILCGMMGFLLFRNATGLFWERVVAMLVLVLASAVLAALLWEKGVPGGLPNGAGGVLGAMGADLLRRWLGPAGVMVLLLPLILISLMVVARFSLLDSLQGVQRRWQGWQALRQAEREMTPAVMVEPEFEPSPLPAPVSRKKAARQEEQAETAERQEMAVHHHEQQAEVESEEMRREKKLSGQTGEVVSGPMAVRHSRWKRMRPQVLAQLRQGMETTEQRLRQAWQVCRDRLGEWHSALLRKGSKDGMTDGGSGAEPEFYAGQTAKNQAPPLVEPMVSEAPPAPPRGKSKLSILSRAVLAANGQEKGATQASEVTEPLAPMATIRATGGEKMPLPVLERVAEAAVPPSAHPLPEGATLRHEPRLTEEEPSPAPRMVQAEPLPGAEPRMTEEEAPSAPWMAQENAAPPTAGRLMEEEPPLALEPRLNAETHAQAIFATDSSSVRAAARLVEEEPSLAPEPRLHEEEPPLLPEADLTEEEPPLPPEPRLMAEAIVPPPKLSAERREEVVPTPLRPPIAVEVWPETPAKAPLSASRAEETVPIWLEEEAEEAEEAEEEVPVRRSTVADMSDFVAFPAPAVDRQALIREIDTIQAEEEEIESAEPVLPPLSMLVDPGPRRQGGPTRETLQQIARTLEQKLADFKIKGQIVDVLPGPVVTTFELDLAPGVRAAKVMGLSDDLARSISVSSVRVVGNVPGKTVIGIEIPNEVRQTVYLKEILSSENFRRMGSPLAVALGSDIFGNPVSGNLAKMPHLLVAGTTGSGKSVAVNAMICSILFSATPKQVRFLMVDPKMLELSIYEGIPHLLAPVVTDVGKAANLLKWAVGEMENRYRLMSELGVRNLSGYNERILQCIEQDEQPMRRVKIGIDPETGRPVEQEEPIPLDTKPLIVIVIDELADLMIQVGKEVEPAIARLAQMARAAGLHLVLATQRPSVDVITGLIKANFPTRLAFQVSSKIDSRTILDAMGADRLLGMGDGLFLPPGTSHLQRIHAPFVSDKEVHDLVKYLRATGKPDYDQSVLILRSDGDGDDDGGFAGGAGGDEQDELYDQAVRIVLRERKVSTSMIQRIFKIGYNRAARMVEQMEAEGLITPPNGAGKREVLAPE
ncbi:MAG: DNA translocase FtsK 4TM domain-containing protein [Magnetococcales bacterium]|nr:DNA translocase FtsK 4TM domain-containing protein [Magnetococcales bacterium]